MNPLEAVVALLEWMQLRDRRQTIRVSARLATPRVIDAANWQRLGQRTETGAGIVTGQRARSR
jgi:hypothetical protein